MAKTIQDAFEALHKNKDFFTENCDICDAELDFFKFLNDDKDLRMCSGCKEDAMIFYKKFKTASFVQ